LPPPEPIVVQAGIQPVSLADDFKFQAAAKPKKKPLPNHVDPADIDEGIIEEGE
jgi:hypothetical protein